jgi:hypothetical protein
MTNYTPKEKKNLKKMYVECRVCLSINQYLISRRQNIRGEPKDPNGEAGKKRTQLLSQYEKANHPTTTKGEITRPLRKSLRKVWD